jgi:hypothetical protein
MVGPNERRDPTADVRSGFPDPLQQPDIPQRAASIHLRGNKSTRDLRQFSTPSRRRYLDTVHVPVDVEVRIIHPHRGTQVQRGIGQLRTELGQSLAALGQPVAECREAVSTGQR